MDKGLTPGLVSGADDGANVYYNPMPAIQ